MSNAVTIHGSEDEPKDDTPKAVEVVTRKGRAKRKPRAAEPPQVDKETVSTSGRLKIVRN